MVAVGACGEAWERDALEVRTPSWRCQYGDTMAGYVHEDEVKREGGSVIKEEFVARKIGHSANKTAYEVQRRRLAPAAQPPRQAPPHPTVGL